MREFILGVIVHIYNPRYSRGGGKRIFEFKASPGKDITVS
jgi:hypothetical protein